MIRPKLAFGILGGTLLALGVVHQRSTVERLIQENAALRQQQSALATTDSADPDEVRRLQIEVELMRLRGEVARLTRELSVAEAKLATAAATEATNALPIRVSFSGQVLELPNSSFKTLGLFVGPNECFLMENSEAQFLLQRLKQVAEARPLGDLALTVENGQQSGTVFDTRGQEGFKERLESFGETGTISELSDQDAVYMGLFPKASRSSRQVELEFNMRDGNGRWTKTPGADPATDVPDASWWGITRVLKVSDGQFVGFRRPAKPVPGLATSPDRSLLLLVKLAVVDSEGRRIFPEEAEATARVEEAAAP